MAPARRAARQAYPRRAGWNRVEWTTLADPRVVAPAVAAAATLALAAWFLALDFENRLHRAFALFLVLRGLATLGTGLLTVPEWNPLWAALTAYFGIALPFAALYFAYVYRLQRTRAPRRRFVLPVLLVAAILLEALYFRDHALFSSHGASGEVVFGPLFLLVGLVYIVYALIANVMILDYARSTTHTPSLLVAGLGFGLICVHAGISILLISPVDLPGEREPTATGGGPPLAAIGAGLLLLVAALAMIPAVLRLRRLARRDAAAREPATTAIRILALPVATAVLAVLGLLVSSHFALGLVQAFEALWTLAFVLLVAYALLRHRLFDIDVRARITIRRTTLAAFFVAAFFIGTELTKNYFETRFDSVVGILAAGLLLLALHPLQRLADRLARVAVPHATPVGALSHPEHLALYKEQVQIAWADGTLSAKERRMLDRTRDRLHISLEESMRVENAVVRSLNLA